MYSLHRAYEVLDIQGWAKSAFSFRKNAFRQKASLENVTLGWKKTFIGEISQTPLKLKAPRAKLSQPIAGAKRSFQKLGRKQLPLLLMSQHWCTLHKEQMKYSSHSWSKRGYWKAVQKKRVLANLLLSVAAAVDADALDAVVVILLNLVLDLKVGQKKSFSQRVAKGNL